MVISDYILKSVSFLVLKENDIDLDEHEQIGVGDERLIDGNEPVVVKLEPLVVEVVIAYIRNVERRALEDNEIIVFLRTIILSNSLDNGEHENGLNSIATDIIVDVLEHDVVKHDVDVLERELLVEELSILTVNVYSEQDENV